jgi:NAD(P)-dependent dehydrogenase (short-subunit alcohol dehydrogenase family)
MRSPVSRSAAEALPREAAVWIVHLAEPAATWITGQVLTVDGGLELT